MNRLRGVPLLFYFALYGVGEEWSVSWGSRRPHGSRLHPFNLRTSLFEAGLGQGSCGLKTDCACAVAKFRGLDAEPQVFDTEAEASLDVGALSGPWLKGMRHVRI